MKEVSTIGIVGFGVMGAAIGMNAAMSGYKVVFKELNDELVKTMFDRWIVNPLTKRVEKGKMDQAQMDKVTSMINGTSKYEDLAKCDIVIEAAVEKLDLKVKIFEDLSNACRKDTVLASNTSTFLIEKVMEKATHLERTAGLHYFFPANVNRLVEVIRQKATNDDTYKALMGFSRQNGKTPITVKDFPGFAINPIFISSYMVLDSFYDGKQYNVATLEDIFQKALGVRFGIMWVQNGSGLGTCYHAAVSMYDYLGSSDIGYPIVPPQLINQFESGKPWDLQDGNVLSDDAMRKVVSDRLLGSIFTISTHLIENNVVSLADLELGIRTSLAWPKGPFTMMNDLGMEETAHLVRSVVDSGDFKMPKKFSSDAPDAWPL